MSSSLLHHRHTLDPGAAREPPKDGPHPAMILLHSASGVAGDRQLGEYQDRLLGAGFAALVVDSYSPRGRANMLQWDPELARQRLFDAVGALRYLQTLPTVDRSRIAVLGASDGGRVALELAAGFAPGAPLPRAVVVYYPACPRSAVTTLQSPVLVHEAELDDWPVQCRGFFIRLADASTTTERVMGSTTQALACSSAHRVGHSNTTRHPNRGLGPNARLSASAPGAVKNPVHTTTNEHNTEDSQGHGDAEDDSMTDRRNLPVRELELEGGDASLSAKESGLKAGRDGSQVGGNQLPPGYFARAVECQRPPAG